jgi:hypothetical protein
MPEGAATQNFAPRGGFLFWGCDRLLISQLIKMPNAGRCGYAKLRPPVGAFYFGDAIAVKNYLPRQKNIYSQAANNFGSFTQKASGLSSPQSNTPCYP